MPDGGRSVRRRPPSSDRMRAAARRSQAASAQAVGVRHSRARLQLHARARRTAADPASDRRDSASSAACRRGRSSWRRPGSTAPAPRRTATSRPALSRTNDCGIRMRAVAIMRTSSSGSSAGRSPSGVPSTRDQHVDRHALRMRIERRQLLQQPQRARAISPMPMMPPQQTVMPAVRTRASVSRRSS